MTSLQFFNFFFIFLKSWDKWTSLITGASSKYDFLDFYSKRVMEEIWKIRKHVSYIFSDVHAKEFLFSSKCQFTIHCSINMENLKAPNSPGIPTNCVFISLGMLSFSYGDIFNFPFYFVIWIVGSKLQSSKNC